MIFKDLDKCFNRALIFAFQKKKLFFTYPFIFLVGIIYIFFTSISQSAGRWAHLSFLFLPIFIGFAILFVVGIFLIRIYFHEVKNLKCTYLEILKNSVDKVFQTFYISIFSIFSFVIVWIIFGVLAAIKDIPHIGSFIGVFLSIIAYLLILFFIGLIILNLLLVFFTSPMIALKSKLKLKQMLQALKNLKNQVFVNFSLFLIAFMSLFVVLAILFTAAILTKNYFAIRLDSIYFGLDAFFIMIPFTILITPFVIFFFNFSLEAYNLMQKTEDK